MSGAGGEFLVRDLDPGAYVLTASKNGYSARPLSSSGVALPTTELRPGETVRDVVIRLVPLSVITGYVTDQYGSPISGAQVQALPLPTQNGLPQSARAYMATTDDRGEYRLFDLEPGEYRVRVEVTRRTTPIDTIIEGEPAYPPQYYAGVEDSARAMLIEVGPGEERPGIDFLFSGTTSFRVSGRILDIPGTAAPNMRTVLRLVPDDLGMSRLTSGTRQVIGSTGEFSLSGVAPGDYFLVATYGLADNQLTGYQRITVTGSDVTDLALRLQRPVNVPVEASVEGENPAAVQLAGTRVMLQSDEGMPFNDSGSVVLQMDEPVEIENLIPGEYRLQVYLRSLNAFLKSVRQGDRDVLTEGVVVTEGGTEPIELLVSPFAASISGIVRGDCSAAQCGVVLIPDEPRREQQHLHKRTLARNGSFQIRGIAPGSYGLLAVEWETTLARDFDPVGTYGDELVSIELEENEQQYIELELIESEEQ